MLSAKKPSSVLKPEAELHQERICRTAVAMFLRRLAYSIVPCSWKAFDVELELFFGGLE